MRWGQRGLLLAVVLTGTPAEARKPAPVPVASPLDALLDRLALGMPPAEAAAALDAARDPRALDALLRYARHLDPSLRAHAVGSLATLAEPRAGAAVRAALGDEDPGVRAAAAAGVAARKDRAAIPGLLALVGKGDAGAATPLAALADADVARRVAELLGTAPDAVVARALGAMLRRPDLGPEDVYVGVVRALGAIPGPEGLAALKEFLDSLPRGSTRASAREARALREQRAGAR